MSQIIRYDSSPIPGSDVEGLLPDSGTSPVLPNGSGYITVADGLNINTVGTANTLTINLDDDVTLTNSDLSAVNSFLQFNKVRGAGIITSGDGLGTINFTGNDGISQIEGAIIEAVTTGTIGVDRIPTILNFYTHPDSVSGAPTLNMALNESGILRLYQYARGVVQSSSNGTLSSSEGTKGQLLIGSSAGAPAWANLTAGTAIGISNGDNSITISADDAVPINFDTNNGTATPAANSLTVAGGTNINTAGSGSTVTVNLDDDITLTNESVSSTSSTIQFDKSRSGGVITTGDDLGRLSFTGNDGTIQVEGARISAESTGTIGSNRVGGQLQFYTHPDSTGSITQRMILDESGTLTILAPDSGTAFTVVDGGADITGASRVTGNISIIDTDNDSAARRLVFEKTRNNNPVQVGDEIGVIIFSGDDDGIGALFTSASIRCIVDSGTIAADRVPTKLDFYTHPDSVAASPTKNMTLDKDGVLTLQQYSDGAIVSDSSGNLASTNDTAGLVLTSNGVGSSPTFQAAAAGGISWSVVTGTTQTLAANNGYFANNGTQVDFSLPATAAVGDTFAVAGMNNATGWTITQGAGQTIHFGDTDTTTGAGGSLTSTATYDVVELVCNVANTDYVVTRSMGNITIV